MTVKTGSAWAGIFVTLDATGALAASADAAGTLYVDGVADAASVTITGSNPYKWSVTLPSLTAGQRVDMYITGTIATIATAGIVASEQADTSLVSEVKAETALILADTGTDGVVLKAAGLAADAVTEIQSGLALEATLTAIKGAEWTDETLAAIDVLIDAIKAKTDLIPATPAVADEYDAALAAIQADLDNPDQYKADVSGLATQASVNAIPTAPLLAANYTAPDNAGIAAIQVKTDLIPASPASAGEYTAAIGAIPTAPLLAANYVAPDNAGIAAIQAKTDDLTFTTPNKVDASATVDTSGVAGAVWDELLASHTDVGSAGAGLAAAGSAGDPWSTALPGAYGAGTAGLALSDILAKTDQLDVSSTSFVTAVSGSTITILRGDTFSGDLLNLGSLASYVTLDFTVKRSSQEADDDAIIRIRKNATGLTDGLVRLNGAAYTTGTDGSITITDAATGDVTIMLKAGVTDDLVPGSYVYDIQLIEAAKVTTLTTGGLVVTADVTRLVA